MGSGGEWLKREVDYSQSKAQNYMKMYQELGDEQESLFGPSKSQALGNLSCTKALQLLALSEPELDEFMGSHDVESMSTRELAAALKERDEALKAAEQARADQSAAEQARQQMERDMAAANARIEGLNSEVKEQSARVEAAREESARLTAELEELRARPVEVAVEADRAAIETARKEAEAAVQAKLDKAKKAQARAEEAQKAAEEAKEKVRQELERAKEDAETVRERAEKAEKRAAQRREWERQQQAERAERERQARLAEEKYEERRKKLEKKYGFAMDGYVIRAPLGKDEILAEARKLQHCVGGYADRHIQGKTTILFMRKAKKPDEPWLTIEMNRNKLVQVHGFKNEGLHTTRGRFTPDPREVYREFLDTWLEWLEKGSKRDKKGVPKLPRRKKGGAA